MSNNQKSYIKTDNDIIINENYISWIKKINNCLHVCTKANGCNIIFGDTHKICKTITPDSYNKLIKHFKNPELDDY
jgi:hypothetical protein